MLKASKPTKAQKARAKLWEVWHLDTKNVERVPMFHPDRLARGPGRMRIYFVRKNRVDALLGKGWGIYMGRLG